ncbi:MAG: DNA cytosine methyltransferase [Candidatus Egerieousia sp.]|nr:DNA cytosine methyltransferase [Candidatus Egerieousia sp.]
MEHFKFIDLFCGIGGFHQAMSDLGGECVYASDIDADCRKTYERNYGIKPDGDITKVEAKDIPEHDVMCGGFPCQAFSKAGKRLGFADPTKGTLFFDIMRIANYHHPKYMLLENVRNLASHDGGNTWRVIHDSIIEAGYNVIDEPVIFSPHYIGVPQHRERVFIMCVRKDIADLPPFYFNPDRMPKCSIDSILLKDDEIDDLARYQLKPEMIEWIDNWNEFLQGIKCDKLPGFPIWADSLCAMKDNPMIGDWDNMPKWEQNFIKKNSELWEQNKEFIDKWLIKAKKNPLFFGSKAKLEWQAGETKHPDLWEHIMQIRPSGLRVKPGTYFPALVAITQTSIVGKKKRYLTPRECARLQSFPDTFMYDVKNAQAYKQFGNSINVSLVRLFAEYMFGDKEVQRQYSYNVQFGKEDEGPTLFDDLDE